MNTIKITPDYSKAGLSYDSKNAVLIDYTLDISQEIGRHQRPAVIICPGGGYEYLSDREGQAVAMRFSSFGINAFVLKYSIFSPFPTALLELAEAVKYVRENAYSYDINPKKIYVCGFSAGGHLAASLGTLSESEYMKTIFGDTELYKANGMILSYPVITSGEYCHKGSVESLLGKTPSTDMLELISLERQVTDKTPETFIWHCADDSCVPVENTLRFIQELSKHNVPFECHIFPQGDHGLALADFSTSAESKHMNPVCAQWFELAVKWLLRKK